MIINDPYNPLIEECNREYRNSHHNYIWILEQLPNIGLPEIPALSGRGFDNFFNTDFTRNQRRQIINLLKNNQS